MKKILIFIIATTLISCSKTDVTTSATANKVSTVALFGVQNYPMAIVNTVVGQYDKTLGKQSDWGAGAAVAVVLNQGSRYHQNLTTGDYFIAPTNMTYKFVVYSPTPTYAQVWNKNPAFTVKFSVQKMNGTVVGSFKDSLNVPISYLCNQVSSPSYNDTLAVRLNAGDTIQLHLNANIYTPLPGCTPTFRNCNWYQIN